MLPEAAHLMALHVAQPGVVEAPYGDRATRLDGEPAAGPVVEAHFVAHPGAVVDSVDRGGHTHHATLALDPVDVGVGDLEGVAEALCGRLQDLVEIEARGKLEARLEQQLIAALGAVARRRAGEDRPCGGDVALEVVAQEAALPAGIAPAGEPAGVGPASHRGGADRKQIGGLLHAQPVGVGVRRPHRRTYRPARADS